MANKLELVGLAEVAAMAGVSRQRVYLWMKRSKDMPQPVARLACGPIWLKDEIRKWLVEIGYTHLRK